MSDGGGETEGSGDEPTELDPVQDHESPTEMEAGPDDTRPTEFDGEANPDHSSHIAHILPESLAAEYEIVRRIDVGGQGSVYLCKRIADETQVAIKLYTVAMSRLDPGVIEKLSSSPPEHIVPTQFGQWGDECWEIQEYMEHGTIAQIRKHFNGELPDRIAREIVRELTEAVEAAHGLALLHRDIKPSNVLIRSLQPFDLVLADFGLTRNLIAGAQVGSRSATPGYRSPDTAQGIWRLESDWWAVGITIYEVLLQRHPFDDEQGRRKDDVTILGYLVENDVPLDGIDNPRWQLLLRGLLTKNADHRWTAKQVHEWLDGGTPPVYRSSQAVDREWEFASFGGELFTSLEDLGRAFATRWEEAAAYITGRGLELLRESLARSEISTEVDELFDRHGRDSPDILVFRLVQLLTRDRELAFRGRWLTSDGLTEVANEATEGGNLSADWIRDLRTERLLAKTTGHANYALLARIDEFLEEWWSRIPDAISNVKRARSDYRSRVTPGAHPNSDLDHTIAQVRSQWEGQLLLAAMSTEFSQALQEAARRDADQHQNVALWVDRLRNHVTSATEPTPPEALLLTTVLPLAKSDADEARALELERQRKEEAEREEQRRRRAAAEAEREEERKRAAREAERRRLRSRIWARRTLLSVALASLVLGMALQDRMRHVYGTSSYSARGASSYEWWPYWNFWAFAAASALLFAGIYVGNPENSVGPSFARRAILRKTSAAAIWMPVFFLAGRALRLLSESFPDLQGVRQGVDNSAAVIIADVFAGGSVTLIALGLYRFIPAAYSRRTDRGPLWGIFLASLGVIAAVPAAMSSDAAFADMMDHRNCGRVTRFPDQDGVATYAAIFPKKETDEDERWPAEGGDLTGGTADRVVVWQGNRIVLNRKLSTPVPCAYMFGFGVQTGESDGRFGHFIAGWALTERGSDDASSHARADQVGYVLAVSLKDGHSRKWNYESASPTSSVAYGPTVVNTAVPSSDPTYTQLRAYSPETGDLVWARGCPGADSFFGVEPTMWDPRESEQPLRMRCRSDVTDPETESLWDIDPLGGP